MSSILYIFITTGFTFLIQIQWCYFHYNWVETDTDISQILKLSLCLSYLSYVIHYIHTYNHQIRILNTNSTVLLSLKSSKNWRRYFMNTETNQIHQNILHLEYFPKRQRHPKCTAAIHPIRPPNGCGKSGIINYHYTRPQISYFQTEKQCQMHPTARSAEIDDVFYL